MCVCYQQCVEGEPVWLCVWLQDVCGQQQAGVHPHEDAQQLHNRDGTGQGGRGDTDTQLIRINTADHRRPAVPPAQHCAATRRQQDGGAAIVQLRPADEF